VAAAPPPAPALIADERTNRRITEAQAAYRGRVGAKSTIPECQGLEPGFTFQGEKDTCYVIIGFDRSKPVYNVLCVAYQLIVQNSTGLSASNIKTYKGDFVLKQLDPSSLKQIQQIRVSRNMAKFDLPPDYARNGFFIEVDGELRKCVIYDIITTDKVRPIKIRELDGGRQWCYPHALFVNMAKSICEQTRKRKMSSMDEAQKRRGDLDDSSDSSDSDES